MAIIYRKDTDHIVTLTMDLAGHSANVINLEFVEALEATLSKLEADTAVIGVIVTSAKSLFLAGADIDTMFNVSDPQTIFDGSEGLKALFRRLETVGKPVVAALNGTALGGGLELALSCHYRIALDNPKIQFGFPEIGLGLLPGAGGVVRTVRLIGIEKGLEWLAQNRKYSPQQALAAGIIDALATDVDDMLAQAKAWIAANPHAKAPWDANKRYKIPGGTPSHPKLAQLLAIAPAYMRKETKGNYPAPHAIMAAAVEGTQVDFTTACRIESRYFTKLASGQVAKNMIHAFWTQLNQIKKGESRPRNIPPQTTQKVGVLGAGMMGHGIAYVSALFGMDVVMTDATLEKANIGKEKIATLMTKRVKRGRMTQEKMDSILARIKATADYDQLQGCDLVIEAVFENRELKAKVTSMAEAVMAPIGVFASNTSTLPINGLANASIRPEKFIGLHFFSPVEKMKLVEIIVGDKTDDTTLAKAFDYVLAIGKIPIVVNDSRGFYTSRVFATWTAEGMAMLGEGNHPHAIEMAGIQAGMPIGPLALMDEVSLSLANHVRQQTVVDLQAEGKELPPHPSDAVIDRMVALGRSGRANGAGFYDYTNGHKRLWPGLMEEFYREEAQLPQSEMIDRILFIQSIETARCLEEVVLRSEADANIGSIFGWGFAPFHGGTFQFIRAYGIQKFIDRAQQLAKQYGPRFTPPQLLKDMAAAQEKSN